MEKIGVHRVIRLLGQGVSGRVFEVRSPAGEALAVKVYHPTLQGDGFLREVAQALTLRHPNVVAVRELGYLGQGERFLVMDLANGGSLRARLQGTPLSLAQVRHAALELGRGLAVLHARGVVHRDLKPENVLCEGDGPLPRLRLCDFGTVSPGGAIRSPAGSPAYMAPEQMEGSCDARSDVYALGVLLFELATGERPFTGAPGDVMLAHRDAQPPLQKLPPALRSVLGRALAKRPDERPASALGLAAAVDAAVSSPRRRRLAAQGNLLDRDDDAGWRAERQGEQVCLRGIGAPAMRLSADQWAAASVEAAHPLAFAVRDMQALRWSGGEIDAPLHGRPAALALLRLSGAVVTTAAGPSSVLGRELDGSIRSRSIPLPVLALQAGVLDGEDAWMGVDLGRRWLLRARHGGGVETADTGGGVIALGAGRDGFSVELDSGRSLLWSHNAGLLEAPAAGATQ
jgi:hypothetical protein